MSAPRSKRKPGRPEKFDPAMLGTVTRLCRLGATNVQLAEALEIGANTVQRWLRERPEFRLAVKEGKVEADMIANDNLFARCQFHEYRKVIPFKVKRVEYQDGKRVLETEEIVEKETIEVIPPDTTALIFWHKNRRPLDWRDRRDVDVTSQGERVTTQTIVIGDKTIAF